MSNTASAVIDGRSGQDAGVEHGRAWILSDLEVALISQMRKSPPKLRLTVFMRMPLGPRSLDNALEKFVSAALAAQ